MATEWVIVWQVLRGCFWPILLKKSAMVSAAKKYALEIEIFTSGKGDWTQISRGGVLNRHFHRSFLWPFLKADFFNSIGRFLPVVVGRSRPEAGHLNDLAQASNHRSLPSTHRLEQRASSPPLWSQNCCSLHRSTHSQPTVSPVDWQARCR